VHHLYKFKNEKWILNDGLRVQGTKLKSTVVDNSTAFRPFTELEQSPVGVSGNLGVVYLPTNKVRLNGGVATGFRAPNIDDLTKIFESSTASRQLVVPNPDIKPEKTITPELGLNAKIGKLVRVDVSVFYTWFIDAIVKDKYPINGQDSSIYNGQKYLTLAAQNNAKANLYGFNTAITISPASGWEIYSTINYTHGIYTNPNGSEIPLDHIPPVFGKTSLRYTAKKWNTEAWCMYNGWKHIEDYNPNGEDNAQYATPEGMPSWATINLRGQFDFSQHLSVQLAIENITDRNYRAFASGFSAAGRNFVVSVRANF
jgi:hemoglobin/transferrin/lactoferrin receptor protein